MMERKRELLASGGNASSGSVYDSSELSISLSPCDHFKSPKPKPKRIRKTEDESEYQSSVSDKDVDESSRVTKHHWWSRLTIQFACCGVLIIEFGWTIVECLIIPYLFLSNTPYYAISWILFFICIFDPWLQPMVYSAFNHLIYKHHQCYYAQITLMIFTIIFLIGFLIMPHSNVINEFMTYASSDSSDEQQPVVDRFNQFPVHPSRIFVSILGYTIMNLCLGYLLIPLRFIINDAMTKISSKQWFKLRKRVIERIYDGNTQTLSKKAEKNYISSFDALGTQIYSLDEYNHYLKYAQRSIAIYQIIGRFFGYLFASIDWLSLECINKWVYNVKYGHIDLCFSFMCILIIIGLCIVIFFTIYVHWYAMTKIKKKKRNFYKFKKSIKSSKKSLEFVRGGMMLQRSLSVRDSLDNLVPTLESKLSFDLTRVCNINPRTKCCYFIIDGIQLHQESVQIYMDWIVNKQLKEKGAQIENAHPKDVTANEHPS